MMDMNNYKELLKEQLHKSRRAMSSMWRGFLLFVVILFLYGTFISPFLTTTIGPFTSGLGALAQTATFIVVALVTYYLYAIIVKRTGADVEIAE